MQKRIRFIFLAATLCLAASCSTDNGVPGQAPAPSTEAVWCNPGTGLCWQTPQKDAYNADDLGVVPAEAAAYCGQLILDGHDDWRLPTIDELRTLVAGSPETESGGTCGVVPGSSTADGRTPGCLGGAPFQGPGMNGCYWKKGLEGTCDKPDPAVVGHPLETWAMNPAADDPEHWIAYVTFDTGAAGFNHTCSLGDVRCVRDPSGNGPPACEIHGTPCTDILPSQAHCDQDLLEEADKIRLTVRLPEPLPKQPHQLLVFLYQEQENWFPPLGPPDGGTDFNQVISPEISHDTPLTLTVPGTTYYREELLAGDFQLYVQVQMEDKFPPIPVGGDYVWGEGRASISFPFDGHEHQGTERAMEVTLEPVGCPRETPVRCPDGSCVADPSLCNESDCPAVPDDSEVLTCRYVSLFIEENCADFPMEDGWTVPVVEAFCKAQMGADASTVAVTQGNSCLVEKGGFDSSTRCGAVEDGDRWWAYGTPQFVCDLFLVGTYQGGPFCMDYGTAGSSR
jgi:hypothetical protein